MDSLPSDGFTYPSAEMIYESLSMDPSQYPHGNDITDSLILHLFLLTVIPYAFKVLQIFMCSKRASSD